MSVLVVSDLWDPTFLKADGRWALLEIEDEEEGSRTESRHPTLGSEDLRWCQRSNNGEKVIQGRETKDSERGGTALLGNGEKGL